MLDYNSFGNKVKTYRKKLNLTQEAFGEKFNKDANEISVLESGKHKPNIQTVVMVLNAFKINLATLFEIENINIEYENYLMNEINSKLTNLNDNEKVQFLAFLENFNEYTIKRDVRLWSLTKNQLDGKYMNTETRQD